MCGLIAVISKSINGFSKEQQDLFNDLLYVDALRGMDSTGVFLIDNKGTMSLAKEASHAADFRRRKEYKDLLSKAFRNGSAMVGHNRAATRGSVTDQNAHPFVVDDRITLVHNGTLWGDHKKLADTEVDSHAIAHVLHEHGNDVEKAMQTISGAYALIWHDYTNKTLNILRNNDRPLFWVETNCGWVYASEHNFIAWALSRNPNIKTIGEIKPLSASCHVKYTQTQQGNWTVDSEEITLTVPYKGPTEVGGPRQDYSKSGFYGSYQFGANDCNDECGDALLADYYANLETQSKVDETIFKPLGNVRQSDLEKREEVLADRFDFAMSGPRFTQMTEVFKDNMQVLGECLEFDEVNGKNNLSGYYVYARALNEPDMMIRQFLPPATPEAEILDMTLNNRKAMFKVAGKTWRRYTNAGPADIQTGFGMVISSGLTSVSDPVNLEDELGFIGAY